MAFHQPTRQSAQRLFRPEPEDETQQAPQLTPQPAEDPQTWVLFSPATDAGTTTSYLTSSHQTNTTPGRSRLSDIGSFDPVARPGSGAEPSRPANSASDAIQDEEDAELDSLDSHLPEFRSTPDFYDSPPALPHATPVVPAHDGLGSFRPDQGAIGADMQERIYAFEQYNPHRVKRHDGLDLAQIDLEDERIQEMEKLRRIETWRLEHSRYLLEEIQKETRRRRRSIANISIPDKPEQKVDEVATPITTDDMASSTMDHSQDWHERDESEPETDRESIWGRITRKVIRDLMGIDDKLLAILFGEALPDEEDLAWTPRASVTPRLGQPTDMARGDGAAEADSGWQLKMLERVATELGHLINRISEHPGAFSTFSRVQQMPLPYAGLASIPEGTVDTTPGTGAKASEPSVAMPEFRPTIGAHARPTDGPHVGRPLGPGAPSSQAKTETSGAAFTQEEWEQDLDVRLVFRYLRSRFMPRSNSSAAMAGTPSLSASSAQDVAAKAARVRQHHPLISRSRPADRRKSKAAVPSNPLPAFKYAGSCASHSTRRSVRRSSCSSSRHYWDIGGSVGTGSMIATTGPMGSWGEV
ncbi:hypothetical protein GGS23DRAFT_267915 [Durotheca rogersii]|uniref:uncharacterized protein n=1 Tax=Durotheca rogersii TaxID=419775 RepID=UPI00221FEBC2|nr:uncharacterized protein GGS23DRAFT_267915 [Durotheca rogersii]KAI5859729.1 hypothetical protein GGS23DRAFT_267915 [Durotheca rogersii]